MIGIRTQQTKCQALYQGKKIGAIGTVLTGICTDQHTSTTYMMAKLLPNLEPCFTFLKNAFLVDIG